MITINVDMCPSKTHNPKSGIHNSEFEIATPTPDDLAFIRALADEHSAGLPERCARYRRRANLRRTAVAALAVVVITAALLLPPSDDTFVDGNLQCCAADACQRVDIILARR